MAASFLGSVIWPRLVKPTTLVLFMSLVARLSSNINMPTSLDLVTRAHLAPLARRYQVREPRAASTLSQHVDLGEE